MLSCPKVGLPSGTLTINKYPNQDSKTVGTCSHTPPVICSFSLSRLTTAMVSCSCWRQQASLHSTVSRRFFTFTLFSYSCVFFVGMILEPREFKSSQSPILPRRYFFVQAVYRLFLSSVYQSFCQSNKLIAVHIDDSGNAVSHYECACSQYAHKYMVGSLSQILL